MTVTDLRCDLCGALLSGLIDWTEELPLAGVRFTYHPGDPGMRDDSGTACASCWARWTEPLGSPRSRRCAVCGLQVRRTGSLHVRRKDAAGNGWQLCPPHAARFLNSLRTVQPKLDPASFRLPLDHATDDHDPDSEETP
jgi:hypothetical protein